MRKSFGGQRVARKIGQDDDEESPLSVAPTKNDQELPSFVKRAATKGRKSSSLRTSFGRSGIDADDDNTLPGVVTPKRSNLSKVAVQRNAERRLAADVPFRSAQADDEERPIYDRRTLTELRDSTPSTPRDLSGSTADLTQERESEDRSIDVASKFGSNLSRYQSATTIPTDAEIREKKERRARLAKEREFISLDAESGDESLDENVTRDEHGKLILKPQDKYPESRLVQDDADIFEDLDEFTKIGEGGLGRKAEKETAAKKRAEMAALIDQAEAQSEEEDDDESEVERNAAFTTTQIKSGRYATAPDDDESSRPRTPPRITPIPTLESVVGRLKERLGEMGVARNVKAQELESLHVERKQIDAEEVRVQAALKETAEKFAKLRESLAKPEADVASAQVQRAGMSSAEDQTIGIRPGYGLWRGRSASSSAGSSPARNHAESDESDD